MALDLRLEGLEHMVPLMRGRMEDTKVLWSLYFTLKEREEGATMVEYAFLVVFIALIAVVGVTLLGGALNDRFTDIADGVRPGG